MATLPSFRALASRRLLPRSGGQARSRGRSTGLPAAGNLPCTPCPKAQPGPLPPRCRRGCGRGGLKPGDPGRRSKPGTGDRWVHHSHLASKGALALALGTRLAAGFLSPEAEGGRGESCSRHQLGSLPGGPQGGQVDWLQADRGASMRLGVCRSRLFQMEAPVYMSARARFPSSWYFCCRSSALGSCRLPGTNGPASPLLRRGISFHSLRPRRSSSPARGTLRQACARSRGRAPRVFSKRVPRTSEPLILRWLALSRRPGDCPAKS